MCAYLLAVDTDADNLARQSAAWRQHGVRVDPVATMQEAIAVLDRKPYIAVGINADCVNFELQLPILRDATVLPIHVLTSAYAIEEHARVLHLGADVYAEWRENPEENVLRGLALFARIGERVRQTAAPVQFVSHEGLQLYPSQFAAVADDQPLDLTRREFDILYFLMRNRDRIVPRDRLFESAWRELYDPGCANRLWVQVSRLRDKLAILPGYPEHIETVKDLGYRFASRPVNETVRIGRAVNLSKM